MSSDERKSEEATAKVPRTPTAGRVAGDTIVDLVYDADRKQTKLAVSRFGGLWNLEQEVRVGGEILVPLSPTNNLIAKECVLLPSEPVDYGSKDELLADVEHFIHRYVDVSATFEKIAAHYVLLTWVHDRFSDLGYLRLRGEFGSGKTRGLLTIGSICYRPFFASAASTVSPIFHILDSIGATLILDEADLSFSDARAEFVKILNNGTTKGMPVLRTMVDRHKEFNPRAFEVFGPKLVAMRGGFADAALESRFITEEVGSRTVRPEIPIQLPFTFKVEALALRNRLLHYRLCHLLSIEPLPERLRDTKAGRLNQTALALLSLIDDPRVRTSIEDLLEKQQEQLRSERSEAIDAQVLKAAFDAFRDGKTADVTIGTIAERYNEAHLTELGRPISNKWTGHILRKQLRIATEKSNGVYVVRRSEWPRIEALAGRFGFTR